MSAVEGVVWVVLGFLAMVPLHAGIKAVERVRVARWTATDPHPDQPRTSKPPTGPAAP